MQISHLILDFDQLKARFMEMHAIARDEVAAERTVIIGLDYVPRTDGQNKHLHHLLGDISKQVVWYGNRLTVKEWKRMLSAGLKKSKVIPGIDHDSFVVVGDETSRMDYKTCADLILLATAFGNERGVRWSMTRDEMCQWGIAA